MDLPWPGLAGGRHGQGARRSFRARPRRVSGGRRRAATAAVAADVRRAGVGADADRQREVTIANAYRDAQKIKGEGDAQAAQIYAESFGRDAQFAQFYQSLEAYRNSFKDKKDVMVVEPSGEFFKFLHKK